MTEFNDEALIAEFITESRDHLATIEPDLLVLEQDGSQVEPELINRIFRAIHSIKGSSGFFGFERLKQLSHVMESLLMQLRDGAASTSPQIVEALLQGVDKLNILLADIHESDNVPIHDEVARLAAFISPDRAPETLSKIETVDFPVEFEAKRPVKGGQTYLLKVDIQQDILQQGKSTDEFLSLLGSIGEVHAIEPVPESGDELNIFFASVLEKDLVSHATAIPGSRIMVCEKNEITGDTEEGKRQESAIAASTSSKKDGLEGRSMTKTGSPDSGESIRVRIDLLNKLMELAGEMVLSRNQLLRTLGKNTHQEIEGLGAIAQSIDLITTDLQEHIMQTRMQPIASVFGKFPRIIRDMARHLDKNITLIMEGEDVELDKSIIESLSAPLTHLIRNCCDHGIEMPEERQRQGKPKTGTILLRAFHQDGQINISISDDGKGIDTDKLVQKALQKNLISEAECRTLSVQELHNLIFLPGLSTADKISDISGRGVGMDVVKTNITRLGGQIQIESTPGEGTSLLLRLPLTLAIIPSLIVGVASQRFAIPQVNLVELVHVRAEDIPARIEQVGTASVLRLRDQLLPLLRLSEVLNIEETITVSSGETIAERRREIADIRVGQGKVNFRKAMASDYKIIVLRAGDNQFGLIVDAFFDIEEIVVKSLSSFLKNCRCFSGATIMGDGLVAMILDPNGIIAHSGLSFESIESERHKLEMLNKQKEKASESQALLLFNNAPSECFAIPLMEVFRLEKFSLDKVTKVGRQEFIHYEGRGLPLLRLEEHLPIGRFPESQTNAYLVIPRQGNGRIGIVVSRVLDVVAFSSEWKPSTEPVQGIAGWALIQDQLTARLDFDALLERTCIDMSTFLGEAS